MKNICHAVDFLSKTAGSAFPLCTGGAQRLCMQTAPRDAALSAEQKEGKPYSGKADYLNGLEKKAVQWTEKQMKIGSYGSMGMCMGMCLGVAIGTATSNLALCMSLGLVIGLFVGTFVGRAKAK